MLALRAPSARPTGAVGTSRPASCATANGGSWPLPGSSQTRTRIARRPPADGRRGRARSARAVCRSSCVCTPRDGRIEIGGSAPDGERAGRGGAAPARRRASDARIAREPPEPASANAAPVRCRGPAARAARAARGRRSRARRAAPPCSRTRSSSARSAARRAGRAHGVDEPRLRRPRRRLRVGDHEEEEDEHLGGGDEHPPEVAPVIGPRCQRAVIAWPHSASTPMPRRTTARSRARRAAEPSRERIAKPPATITASASTSHGDIGPHQKSSGAARFRPRIEEAQDEPDVRRVEDVRRRAT